MLDKKLQVLIVDDSKTQALVLSKQLKQEGIEIELAHNGEEGLIAADAKDFDFIITDVTMPKMDGFEFCKNLRDNPKTAKIPVIILTALFDPSDVLKAIKCGADFFLTKPSRADLILQFFHDYLLHVNKEENRQPVEFVLGGNIQKLDIDVNRLMTLLFSTYRNAVEKNRMLERAEHKLRESNCELKIVNELKNTFLGMAAHDLRNPLTVIKGYCDVLSEDLQKTIDEKQLAMLRHISKAAEKIRIMVDELLNVSVIESGKLVLDLKKQSLQPMIENSVEMMVNVASQKNILINLEAEAWPEVVCDEKKVDEVITNFLTNAVKYSKPETKVTVRVKQEGQFFAFYVEDQGQGIPQEEQNKLFKTFSKTSVMTTAGESSTGLGLAIVKKIVEAHGGEIGFTSEPGKGSTFYAKFPLEGPGEKA